MKARFLLFIIFLSALCCHAAEKKKLTYIDASDLTIINRAQPDGPIFQRLDVDKYPDLSDRVRYYYSFPTGMAVRFRTNSPTIAASWETDGGLKSNNCTPTAENGLDLYIKRDGKWIFAAVGRPKFNGTEHKATLVADMDTTTKECMLYLPLCSVLNRLEIGVEPGSKIEAASERPKARIVFVGSSYTHGIGASRAGLTFPAILGRRMNIEAANLGASGQCKIEQFYAHVICETQADAFVIDPFSNPTAEMIDERLIPFIETIRKCHPTTPLIFLQTEKRESTNFSQKIRKSEYAKREAARRQMLKAMQQFDNIYFLNPGMSIGTDHEASCDGIHPSDLGVMRVVETMQPELEAILMEEGILK